MCQQGKRNKKLFWVPAIAPLLSVILSTFFVFVTHAEKEGVAIVSHSVSLYIEIKQDGQFSYIQMNVFILIVGESHRKRT